MCWTVFALYGIYLYTANHIIITRQRSVMYIYIYIDSNRQREYFNFHTAAKHFQSTTSIGTNEKRARKWANLKAFCVLWYFLIFVGSVFFYFIFFSRGSDPFSHFAVSVMICCFYTTANNGVRFVRISRRLLARLLVCAVIFTKLLRLCGYVLH